jgi:hypothetical protein
MIRSEFIHVLVVPGRNPILIFRNISKEKRHGDAAARVKFHPWPADAGSADAVDANWPAEEQEEAYVSAKRGAFPPEFPFRSCPIPFSRGAYELVSAPAVESAKVLVGDAPISMFPLRAIVSDVMRDRTLSVNLYRHADHMGAALALQARSDVSFVLPTRWGLRVVAAERLTWEGVNGIRRAHKDISAVIPDTRIPVEAPKQPDVSTEFVVLRSVDPCVTIGPKLAKALADMFRLQRVRCTPLEVTGYAVDVAHLDGKIIGGKVLMYLPHRQESTNRPP